MSKILGKYDEAINLTYNNAFRMMTHLKNIRENYYSLKNPEDIILEVYRDSIVKKYETLEDLTWKLLAKIFKADGIEVNSPRGAYKQAFKYGLIEDMVTWNNILNARNLTAHIYDEDDYEEVKESILNEYLDAIEELLNRVGLVN